MTVASALDRVDPLCLLLGIALILALVILAQLRGGGGGGGGV